MEKKEDGDIEKSDFIGATKPIVLHDRKTKQSCKHSESWAPFMDPNQLAGSSPSQRRTIKLYDTRVSFPYCSKTLVK